MKPPRQSSPRKPSRKTGVLTFHRCINYGTYWQARCLVESLRARDCDAVLVDHASAQVNAAEWKCGLQPVLPTPVPKKDYVFYGWKIVKFLQAAAALPCSRRFALGSPEEMEAFDLVVVGSDEVWNLRHPWYGGYPLFFGDGVRARRLISYAASFGNYDARDGLEPAWADRLRAFDAISVRDANSRSIIRDALGFAPPLVLDPCLLAPPRPQGPWRGPRRPYVAVYGHNFSSPFSRKVRRWARRRGYRLVSIGYRNSWADAQWITAGPHDFAHFIARAQAVATNFFHGCIFALRNAKPFVSELSTYRSNKLRDLMAAVNGEHRLVTRETPGCAYDACLETPLEGRVVARVRQLREQSARYLDEALAA